MKLVLLGTAGYHPNDRRHTACLMLPEAGFVLDAGTGMYRVRDRLATDELDIFLTHAHLDHVVGLSFLLDVLYGRTMRRVAIHGEAGKLTAIRQHLYADDLFPVPPAYDFLPLTAQVPLAGGGKLTYFPLVHPGGSVGFRLDWPGRSLAYVTDTTADPQADYVAQIAGVDLLVHECNFRDDQRDFAMRTGHSHTSPVAQVASKAKVGRLVLTHINPLATEEDPVDLAVARAIFPNTHLGHDGLEIEF